MTGRLRWPLLLWPLVVVGGAVGLPLLTATPAEPRVEPTRVADRPYGGEVSAFRQLSSGSCASDSCHGGAAGTKGGEHSTWAAEAFPGRPSDPHARAHRVLFNEVSRRIGTALDLVPHRDARCLDCHAVPGAAPEWHADGVGCGGCHGAAEKWNAAHVAPGWSSLSARAKFEGYGFAPTRGQVGRSTGCVGCHVGDATREVNHDLIAAGHPRLGFEATRFHFDTSYARHWVEKTPQPDFEARAWLIGQAATARAATELLRVRASRAAVAGSATPWPEFAGQSCYACHQSLGTSTAALAAPKPAALAGWEVGVATSVGVAADFTPAAYPGTTPPGLAAFAALQREMAKRSPGAAKVAGLAADAVAEFDAWLAQLQAAEDSGLPRLAADVPRQVVNALAAAAVTRDRAALADSDWDALAARYLGCAAMYHAGGGRATTPAWAAPVRRLAGRLAFPADARGARFNSPAGLGEARGDILRDFHTLLDATAQPKEPR